MIGKSILHYRILEKLGEGGMGVVYLAEDTKLGRRVAIKLLPHHNASDANASKRFETEAQAAAALNHPNVATIYSIEETDNQTFLVMEYIEGKELKDIINSSTSLLKVWGLNGILDYVMQIASGLQAAHSKEIVHRDIKSANIMLNNSGNIKIMDFGLARFRGTVHLTKTGTTVGTIAYMAPEQFLSNEVDHLADIWSFGVVLYELLTGELPFKGEYDPALQYAIINTEPIPLAHINKNIPSEFQAIIDKTLDKDVETRYQNMADIIADLKRIKKETRSVSRSDWQLFDAKIPELNRLNTPKKENAGFPYKKVLLSISLIFMLFLIIFSLLFYQKNTIKNVTAKHTQLTFTGEAYSTEISPDGNSICYLTKEDNNDILYVRDLSGGTPIEIFNSSSIYNFQWLPNSREISFTAYLNDSTWNSYLIPRFGGEKRTLNGIVYCWSPEGDKYAGAGITRKYINVNYIQTGDKNTIDLKGNFSWRTEIDWSSRGKLLFKTEASNEYAIWTINEDGTQQQKVLSEFVDLSSPRWNKGGDAIYYLRESGLTKDLMKLKIDPVTGESNGSPVVLQSGLRAGTNISLDSENQKLIYDGITEFSNLKLIYKVDKTYKIKDLITGTAKIFSSNHSPDGKKIALSKGNKKTANIYILDIKTGVTKQITYLNSFNYSPVWSPDGKEIAFSSNEGGSLRIWEINSDGGQPVPFKKSKLGTEGRWVVWAPNKNILYQRPDNRNFHYLNPQTEEENAFISNDSVGWIFYPVFSHDLKKTAVLWNRYKEKVHARGLWVISDSVQQFIKPGSLYPIQWTLDNNSVYVQDSRTRQTKILKINIKTGYEEIVFICPFNTDEYDIASISPDGKTVVANEQFTKSDAWLMENFDSELQ